MNNIYIKTLGCDKNGVDSNIISAIVIENGYKLTSQPEEADMIIVNTCAFISDAKKEAIDTILELSVFKQYGKCSKLIVSGCLTQRYADEIKTLLPEVDGFVGVSDFNNILKALTESSRKLYINDTPTKYEEYNIKTVPDTLPFGYAFVRIADGCDRTCSFCAIPKIRGKYRSRKIEDICDEVKFLADNGVKEINLIAQETSFYGIDIYKSLSLIKLLESLNKIDGIEWIRVLYQNPELINDEFIDSFVGIDKVIPYFDIPMQHCNLEILKSMNRGGSYDEYIKLINKIRNADKDSVIRTSLITGFYGEDDAKYNELLSFIDEAKFDRLGVFTYSFEEGTLAEKLSDDGIKVSDEEAMYRRDQIMKSQIDISREMLLKYVGTDIDVLIEGNTEDGLVGRSKYDAPEVDGFVYLEHNDDAIIGNIVRANIVSSGEYDLYGVIK